MASLVTLTTDDILGRKIDVLGITKIGVGSAFVNQISPIFTTGNIYYPSGLSRVYVSHVGWSFQSGVAPTTNQFNVQIGQNGGSDWSNGIFDFGTIGYPASGIIAAYASPAGPQPPIYARGLAFTIKNLSGATSTDLVTITAYGWAE